MGYWKKELPSNAKSPFQRFCCDQCIPHGKRACSAPRVPALHHVAVAHSHCARARRAACHTRSHTFTRAPAHTAARARCVLPPSSYMCVSFHHIQLLKSAVHARQPPRGPSQSGASSTGRPTRAAMRCYTHAAAAQIFIVTSQTTVQAGGSAWC